MSEGERPAFHNNDFVTQRLFNTAGEITAMQSGVN